MNIILLSGGSGKRLWPLSNRIRSKQFIQMLQSEDGNYESMAQRTYRQISEVDPSAKVTIATSREQIEIIKKQLGHSVSVCIEPAHKDTFPAIALACAYLKDVHHLGRDEPVIVCPVDSYVDNTYFEVLLSLSDLAAHSEVNLSLLGIQPFMPSEKYGYIIPENSERVSKVRMFREKPDTEMAKKYIDQGGLWNGGVFAFKLGYLLDRAHEEIAFSDYMDLFNRYDEQQAISFDYAIVEHEPSTQVMRFAGSWRDIGTWNTFAESMSRRVIGNAYLDKTCENTNIFNELGLPILCMNCKNMIISASTNGILVSEKHQSAKIKPYVEKIERQTWSGAKSTENSTILEVQGDRIITKIQLSAGQHIFHPNGDSDRKIWAVTGGNGEIIVDGRERKVQSGDCLTIPAASVHSANAGDRGMQMIEIQLGKEISVDDRRKYSLELQANASNV